MNYRKTVLMSIILIISSFFLTGCLGIFSFLCDFAGDSSPHCYQWIAVKDGDYGECDKIPQDSRFKDVGSNPPKDKCYLRIAEDTGNTKACDSIKGGMYSYTVDECYEGAAVKNENPDLCAGAPDETTCRSTYANQGSKDCGKGYKYHEGGGVCIKSEEEPDPECKDPTFTSKCTSSNMLMYCEDGKKYVKDCEFGCFEAECRKTPGKTDMEPEPEPKDEEPEKGEDKEEGKPDLPPGECFPPCFSFEACQNGECVEVNDDQCKSDSDCSRAQICFIGECVEDPLPAECSKDSDCLAGEKCSDAICMPADAECYSDSECKAADMVCDKGKCVNVKVCSDKDKYCVSDKMVEFCQDGKMVTGECDFGCDNGKCLTQQQKEEKDKEKEKEESCKESYKKCISDTTLEFCQEGKKIEGLCEFGCKGGKCLPEKIDCPWWNPFCSEPDDDIEDKTEEDIKTIGDAAGGKYMELLDEEIEKAADNPAKLRGLEKYKEFLEQAGETMEGVQTTVDGLNNLKRIFIDSYDPKMDIENMPVDKILRKGLFDRVSDSIFGGPSTEAGKEMAEAEDSLTVYEAMLKRQEEIDFLKQSRMERLGDTISEELKGKAAEEAADKAEEIAEGVAGKAMVAVSVVKYALDSFQDEAKKQTFIGLARAYNRRRAALEDQHPDMSDEDIHKLAVKEVQEDPYQDSKGGAFIKYGNILENQDCQAGTGNQLCIDNRVFWTSMGKSYEYTNRDELHKRFINQFDRQMKK